MSKILITRKISDHYDTQKPRNINTRLRYVSTYPRAGLPARSRFGIGRLRRAGTNT